jgi:hypothetical protein
LATLNSSRGKSKTFGYELVARNISAVCLCSNVLAPLIVFQKAEFNCLATLRRKLGPSLQVVASAEERGRTPAVNKRLPDAEVLSLGRLRVRGQHARPSRGEGAAGHVAAQRPAVVAEGREGPQGLATTAKGESYREGGLNMRYAWVMAQGGYRALTMGAIGGPIRPVDRASMLALGGHSLSIERRSWPRAS